MSTNNSLTAVYRTELEADAALKELLRRRVDLHNLAIVGKRNHTAEHGAGSSNTSARRKYLRKTGAFWGGLSGLLFGSAFFAIPGIGPVLVAGPAVAWNVGRLQSAILAGGVSARGAGLCSIGIPKDSIVKYEAAIKADQFLRIVHGTAAEVARAKEIITKTTPPDRCMLPCSELHAAANSETALRFQKQHGQGGQFVTALHCGSRPQLPFNFQVSINIA